MNNNILSYASIFNDRYNFIKSGTNHGSDFNLYDTPSNKYFKILFYFSNGDSDNNIQDYSSNGLLAPTWLSNPSMETMYMYNTAYSYLILNEELERAELLKDFVNLLSNISSESPWCFKELSGLDSALERNTSSIKFEDDRKKISIKCIQDSYDNRISTLMDLYRSIVWSWQMKREVLPSNLRKFDMGIYIFDNPMMPFYVDAGVSKEYSGYKASYKYIEFHNCEFDYNSAKSPWSSIDNSQGIQPEYTIDIYFDDCYETSYNEFMLKEFGDMIMWDITSNTSYINRNLIIGDSNELNKKLESGGFFSNSVAQLFETGKSWTESKLERVILGNIYTYSLTRLEDQAKTLLNGGIMETANAITEYIDDRDQRNNKGRYHVPETIQENLFNNQIQPQSQINTQLGNIFKANTLINNI